MVCLLFVTVCALGVFTTHAAEWVNPLGGMLSRSCLYGYGISALTSEFHAFHNNKTDRQYDVQCSQVGKVPHGENCYWQKDTTKWTEDMYYMCNTTSVGFEGYVSGLYSDYNNTNGDRRWRIECCTSLGVRYDACVKTEYENMYKGDLNFVVPPEFILHGVISKFSSNHGDRRWQFVICHIDETSRKKNKNSTLRDHDEDGKK